MFLRCNGVVLHARRAGDPGRPLIVFSNALGTDTRIWDEVLPLLTYRYSVLLYDSRGHGLSEAPPGPYGIAQLADDLRALVDAAGAPRFALVGLSVGGMTAQRFAAEHPDRVAALVLCDTAVRIGEAATWDARIETAEYKGLEALGTPVMERWFAPTYRAREPVALQGWRTMLVRQPAGGYAATCAAIRDADLSAEAARIRTPTLCVTGDQDLSTPPDLVRATADRIPGARFAVIPEAGHIPCVEQPAVLAGLIADHLARAGFA